MMNSLTSWRFIFAVIIFLHHYSFSGGSVFPAVGVYLGNTSFCFFMIHQLVSRVLYAGSAYFHIDVRNWSGLILAFFLSLLGGICCYHLIELPLTKYFNSKLKR